jgi:hypothetical protein
MGVLNTTRLDASNVLPALVSLALLVPFVAIVYRIWRALATPLRDIPGPFAARFTRLWYLKNVWRGDFEKVNVRLHDRYGPIVRIAPNEYSIDDSEAIKIIYGHGTGFTKVSSPLIGNFCSNTDSLPRPHGITPVAVLIRTSITCSPSAIPNDTRKVEGKSPTCIP